MIKNADKIYQFVGPGVGIPGLPHLVTKKNAEDMGALEILEGAIKNGSYELLKKNEPIKAKEEKPNQSELKEN